MRERQRRYPSEQNEQHEAIVMFGLLKNPTKAASRQETHWSDFKRMDYCEDCGKLEEYTEFKGVCPGCGSEKIKKVIARWEYCWVSEFFCAQRKNLRHEIKT